ncbi:MAG TPA: ABC transporter substrate-binding protein, partial [Desulfosalsimonadaceae bacterium]|nr:ABC transporter substrate-binding protein [Desulfosalsimonadaceae bacterium]
MLCKYRDLIQSLLLLLVLLAAGSAIMTAAACPAQALEITDATGHTVSLEDHPQRIALAGKGTILVQNTVYLFGEAEERVIALENRRQSAFRFLPVVDPHISGKTFFAVNAGPEQIAAVKPDLVLMKNFMAGQLGGPLEKLDLPVLYLNLETPEAFYRDIQTLGAVFGNPERAEEIDRFYRSRVQQVCNLVADTGKTPRVLIL